jgi:hypothetical protein
MADADKPVARFQIDTRAYGPLICAHCDKHDEEHAESETALLMEDGGVVCPHCRTPFEAFEQFSNIITSVEPVKIKGAGHVCGDRCRRRGCKYDFPQEAEGNPSSCAVHDTSEDCRADRSACRYGGCDGVENYQDGTCKTPPRHYADTKSFFCDEHRKKFLKDHRWDDEKGAWVER